MRRLLLSLCGVLVLGAISFIMIQTVRGQGSAEPILLDSETQGENRREIQGDPLSKEPLQPSIGFIQSPSATCYQPNPARDECLINWYFLSVDAAPNYMITMTLTLNEKGAVAHTQGFFQTSMYVPYAMLGDGIEVACGSLGSSGNPQLGKSYAYTVRARDSAGLSSANYGTVYCPAYVP